MMRLIASVHLSVAHSEDRSWGKWCTTIKTMSLLSAASPTLIELTDWLSAVRGACPAPDTRLARCSKARKWLEHLGHRHTAIGAAVQHPRQRSRHVIWSRNPVHHRKPGSRCDTRECRSERQRQQPCQRILQPEGICSGAVCSRRWPY